MDTIQCAVLLGKLPRFDWEVQRRIELGARYAERIRASGAPVGLLTVRPDRNSVWAQYTVLVNDRDGVQERLKQAGIPTAVHYPRPLNRQPAYEKLVDEKSLPVSDQLAGQVMSLPMSADLTEAQQDQVVEALARAVR